MTKNRHIGRLVCTAELFLQFFDYPDGSVLNVQWGLPEGYRENGHPMVTFWIEHPDMPEVEFEGGPIEQVTPAYEIIQAKIEGTRRIYDDEKQST
tara:strand:- start:79 stop:363 length:285 start_codon:yes stop_codon:yes gene_type:complete